MADTSDDKKVAEGATGDAAYDVLEKDFQEVCVADHCMHLAFQSFLLEPETRLHISLS